MSALERKNAMISLIVQAVLPVIDRVLRENKVKCMSQETFDQFFKALKTAYEDKYKPPPLPCMLAQEGPNVLPLRNE